MASKRKGRGPASVAGLFLLLFVLGFLSAYLYKTFSGDNQDSIPVVEIPVPVPVIDEPREPEYKANAVIVIDDMGYGIDKLREIIDVGYPVSVAIIPFLPDSENVAYEAGANGLEVLVHMPMEPSNLSENNPGKGALITDMGDEELRSLVLRGIKGVPGAVGLNNHMGSRFTEDSDRMAIVLKTIKEKDLFFLDSKTSPKSVAGTMARDRGIRTIDRSVFLDNEQEVDYIRKQFNRVKEIALKKGVAVAIGHPYKETLKVLKEEAVNFEKEGIKLVTLSEVVK